MMTPEDCVKRALEVANFFSVVADIDYVRSQAQHIIDEGRGENLPQWCDGWLTSNLIYSTKEYQAFVGFCKNTCETKLNKIKQLNPNAIVFNFEAIHGKSMNQKLEYMRTNMISRLGECKE